MASVEERAQASFNATMARTKRLDAQGNRSGCTGWPSACTICS